MRSAVVMVSLLGGCDDAAYEAMKAERDTLKAQLAASKDETDQARARVKELEKELSASKETKPNRPPEAQVASALAELKLGAGDKVRAVFETSLGAVDCELFPQLAPATVLNFVGLAEGTKEWTDPVSGQKTTKPLYDGTKFHRVIKGFMVQGGDPLGTGRGGPGFQFPDEVWPDVRFDRPGLLAMANAGPNTNGSQFFITDSKPAHLNMRHTIFGQCELETVRKIMDAPTGGPENSTPVNDIVLRKLKIVREKATAP